MTRQDFRERALPILQWSKAHDPECRHFVKIDDSAEISKDAFKANLLLVEDYFLQVPSGRIDGARPEMDRLDDILWTFQLLVRQRVDELSTKPSNSSTAPMTVEFPAATPTNTNNQPIRIFGRNEEEHAAKEAGRSATDHGKLPDTRGETERQAYQPEALKPKRRAIWSWFSRMVRSLFKTT